MALVVQIDLPPWEGVGVAFGLGHLLHQVGVGVVVDQAVQVVEACRAFLVAAFLVVGNQVVASCQVEAFLTNSKNTKDAAHEHEDSN